MENFEPGPEDILRYKMGNFSEEPDPEVWNLINKNLPSTAWHRWVKYTPLVLLLLITGAMFGSLFGTKYFASKNDQNAENLRYNQLQMNLCALEDQITFQNINYNAALERIMSLETQNNSLLNQQVKNQTLASLTDKENIADTDLIENIKISESKSISLAKNKNDFTTTESLVFDHNLKEPSTTNISLDSSKFNKKNAGNLDSLEEAENVFALDSIRYKEKTKALPPKQSKWWFGGFVAPEYSYRQLNGFKNIVEEKNQYERAKLDMSVGLDLVYQASSKLSFQSGLQFLNMGERYVVNEIYKKTTYDTTQSIAVNTLNTPRTAADYANLPTGPNGPVKNSYTSVNSATYSPAADQETANSTSTSLSTTHYGIYADSVVTVNYDTKTVQKPIKADLRSTYMLVSIPLMVNYTFFQKQRLSLFASAGGSLNILVGGQNVQRSSTGDVNLNKIVNSGVLSGSLLARVGLAVKVTENIKFTLAPTFRYFMNSAVNENKQVQIQPYSISFQFGILKRF